MQMFQQQHLQQQQMMNQILQRQQQSEEQQHVFMQNVVSSIKVQVPPNPEHILDSLANNIKDFRYDVENNITFAAWYTRYDDLFEKDASRLDDDAKVRLLMRKLGVSEHDRYVSFILPKLPKDFSFSQTIEKLKMLFGCKESVVSRRYKCLQISKNPTEDFITFACRVNKHCVEFELGKLTEDQFKCLMFVCGLRAESDVDIRMRLLSKIEEHSDVTLEIISEGCQRLLNLKHDNAMIESQPTQVNTIRHQYRRKQFVRREQSIPKPASGSKEKPQTPCWFCGAFHFARDCGFKSHKCSDCGQFGHREGYCNSAKKARGSMRRRKKLNVASRVVKVNECSVQKRRRFVPVLLGGFKCVCSLILPPISPSSASSFGGRLVVLSWIQQR
ncbi:uncharacterized protein LOC129777619 [Toxorhynchites rutilus septentrionalis]|uniref:uncharacterized protein LOC129777619 n=1 Tax=Toxorhynchites rutilus septentrionalis TaxID=329112 RepID=UPI00247AE75A|nr:uncharacterized protein LOC129777619 [Toxorhynchites rutilus septentrionalis]